MEILAVNLSYVCVPYYKAMHKPIIYFDIYLKLYANWQLNELRLPNFSPIKHEEF